MQSQPLPLLSRTPMELDESLNSSLVRLAKLNGYTPPGILSELVIGVSREPSQSRGRIGLSLLVMTYERQAILTRTAISLYMPLLRIALLLIPQMASGKA